MLGDVDVDRGKVEDLAAGHARLRRVGEACPAPLAACRFVSEDRIGVGDLRQGFALVSGLPAWFEPGLAAQRLRGRFGQAIARRWLRGVPGGGGELAFKLRDPCVLAQDVGIQPGNFLGLLRYQLGELVIAWPGHDSQYPAAASML